MRICETLRDSAREKATTTKGKKRSRENTVEDKRRTRKNRKKRKRLQSKSRQISTLISEADLKQRLLEDCEKKIVHYRMMAGNTGNAGIVSFRNVNKHSGSTRIIRQ